MSVSWRLAFAAVLAAPLSGCPTSSAGPGSGEFVPGTRAPWCPETVPQQGAACTPGPTNVAGGVGDAPCEYPYGTNPHCTTIADCFNGAWSLQKPDPSCDKNPSSCPATFDAGDTDMCPNELCTYAAGRCSCNTCTQGVCNPSCRTRDSGTEWYCWPWDYGAIPGCTLPRPLLGTSCFGVDASAYCTGIWDPSIICVGGYWVVSSGGC